MKVIKIYGKAKKKVEVEGKKITIKKQRKINFINYIFFCIEQP